MERVYTQVYGATGALVEKEGKFLLVCEAGKQQDRGKWNIPAGWIDVGENPLDAVEREVGEETGFLFTPKAILGVYSLVRTDLMDAQGGLPHSLKVIFLGEINETHPRPLAEEITETRWFTAEEIATMNAATLRMEDVKKMVRHYRAGRRYPLPLLTFTSSP